jgi:hypothetical protein
MVQEKLYSEIIKYKQLYALKYVTSIDTPYVCYLCPVALKLILLTLLQFKLF